MNAQIIQQVMPRVNGVPFRCECGCNVFSKVSPNRLKCNACDARYETEPAATDVDPRIMAAALVLARIADRYDENALDDEARKFWGLRDEHQNATPPERIILYAGRGGGTLLTLADCLAAREALRSPPGG